jgi:hypothetical protein
VGACPSQGEENAALSASGYTSHDIIQRGQEIYERDIRRKVEVHQGKMLALDVDSGEYSLADESITAFDRLKARVPNAAVYLIRVGFPTAVRIGGGHRIAPP